MKYFEVYDYILFQVCSFLVFIVLYQSLAFVKPFVVVF